MNFELRVAGADTQDAWLGLGVRHHPLPDVVNVKTRYGIHAQDGIQPRPEVGIRPIIVDWRHLVNLGGRVLRHLMRHSCLIVRFFHLYELGQLNVCEQV